jgi:hypothetical protein
MTKTKTVGDVLKDVHVQMVNERGVVITQEELARWYGINYQVFNKYYNDERKPHGDNLHKLGAKTPEIYDVLGQERPDERLLRINQLYKTTPPEKRDELLDLFLAWAEAIGVKVEKLD